MALINHTIPVVPARFVETLRKQGLRIRVQHFRYTTLNPVRSYTVTHDESTPSLTRVSKHVRKEEAFPDLILQSGGETRVSIQTPDGREASAVARCSRKDPYRKRLGVYLAAKRALANLPAKTLSTITPAAGIVPYVS